VSCQLFCISKKIDEVDAVMTPELQKSVLETHPELVFCRLNGSKPLTTGKKKQGGVQQRRALLMSEGFVELDNWLNARAPKVARDDVLDACACAIAGRDRKRRIPECPETDSNGLRMEMWF
jgi:predicted RNase H-like nuclease